MGGLKNNNMEVTMDNYTKLKIDFAMLKRDMLNGEYKHFNDLLEVKDELINEEIINYYMRSRLKGNKNLGDYSRLEDENYCKLIKQDAKNYIMELAKVLNKEEIMYKLIKNNVMAFRKNYMSKDLNIEQLVQSLIEVATIQAIVIAIQKNTEDNTEGKESVEDNAEVIK
jgi:hypothetical protein